MDDFSLTAPEKPDEAAVKTTAPRLVAPLQSSPKKLFVVPSGPVEAPLPEEPPKKKRGRPPKAKTIDTPSTEIVVVSAEEQEKEFLKRAPQWHPTEDQYRQIYSLAELGWPSPLIAEALEVSSQAFAGAIIRYPRVKQEYDNGVAACKTYLERKLAWRPTPEDIRKTRSYAATGLGEVEIAAKLEVSRGTFANRVLDTPQLKEALELGDGEYRAGLIETSETLLKFRDPDLKHVSSMMIFKLKAKCGLTETASHSKVTVEGNVNHSVQLKVPKTVPVDNMAAYAAAEMARAHEATKKCIPGAETVDVEVQNA